MWRMNSLPVPPLNPVADHGRTSDRYFKQGRYTVGFQFAALDRKLRKKRRGKRCINQGSQRNRANRLCQDTDDKISIGMGSQDCEVWEVPRCAIFKQQKHKS